MDVKVTQTEMCVCGRQVVSVTGRCGECIREGSEQWWKLVERDEVPRCHSNGSVCPGQ